MSSPFRSYVICTSPRSGSTLLCKLLEGTGRAGHPGSHFHEADLTHWQERFGIAPMTGEDETELLQPLFDAALRMGDGGTGLFGLRMQRHSFPFFRTKLRLLYPREDTDLDAIKAAFGSTLFIYLKREDKLAQAISYTKADQTGLWHRKADGSELERLKPAEEPIYDGPLLKQTREMFLGHDREWEAWFTDQGISPCRLTYEEMSLDPVGGLNRVLEALGLAVCPRSTEVPTARLSDQLSLAWGHQFRKDYGSA